MKDITKLALRVKGKIWIYPTSGDPTPYRAVIQDAGLFNMTHKSLDGHPQQLRAYVIPTDPKTAPQLARRELLKNAVAAWHSADQTTRNQAMPTAHKKRVTLFNAWVSDYIRNNGLPTITTWDSNGTTWDAGTTTWSDLT